MSAVVYTASPEPMLTRVLRGAFEDEPIEGLELAADRRSLEDALGRAEILVIMDSQLVGEVADVVVRSSALQWIQLASSGHERAAALGLPSRIAVTHAPTVWGALVAEHAVALLLALVRGVPRALQLQGERRWSRVDAIEPLTTLNSGTAVTVGAGAIGVEVARRLAAFGMRVIGVSRSGTARDGGAAYTSVVTSDQLDDALGQADVAVVCVPLLDGTTGYIGRDEFAAMKAGGYFVNVSRGGVVDADALLEVVRSGQLAGIGLDVTDPEPLDANSELWEAPNVLITPHVAGWGGGPGFRRLREFVEDNLARWKRGDDLVHRVRTR